MSPNQVISGIFTSFQEYVNAEHDIKEEIRNIIKNIEKPLREIITELQIIHQDVDVEKMHAACLKARQLFEEIRNGFDELDKVVPPKQYYRYNDTWRFATQKLCFLVALTIFLEQGILVDKNTTAQIMGMDNKNNIHLDLEDYLTGLLLLASELARFAVNSVTYGDYERPLQISRFVAELDAGFRLLNLKNDSLRRRFDSLKYDVKKIEQVVYDLSIRGLTAKETTEGTSTS